MNPKIFPSVHCMVSFNTIFIVVGPGLKIVNVKISKKLTTQTVLSWKILHQLVNTINFQYYSYLDSLLDWIFGK